MIRVPGMSGHGAGMEDIQNVSFAPVTTKCLRAAHAAVGGQEFEALAPDPVPADQHTQIALPSANDP